MIGEYMCDICGESPNTYDRFALVFNDEKDKAQIKGHKKCINEIEKEFEKAKKKILKRSTAKNKKATVKQLFNEMNMDLNKYIIKY